MMLRSLMLAALACAAAAPLAAQTTDQDVRCAVASNVFKQQEKNPGGQQIANAASFYYLGRLDARMSTPQLKAAMLAQAKAMKMADLPQTMKACASRLAQKVSALEGGAAPAAKAAAAKAK